MGINFEEDTEYIATDVELSNISALIKSLKEKQQNVKRLEKLLAIAQAEVKQLAQRDLPEAMKAARLSHFGTDDGLQITLKEEVYASITEENREAAFMWLTEHGLGDMVKSTVELNFGRGELETRDEFIEGLQEVGVSNYKVKETIHPQTLKAWVREKVAQGEDFPKELFGVFEYKEAVLK